MIAQEDDPAMLEWLNNAQHKGGGFVSSLADAGRRADPENYRLMRPLLLVMRMKYPQYEPTPAVLEELRAQIGVHVPAGHPELALAVCVNAELAPDFPAHATYSTFEKMPCPDCGQDMWVGANVKAMVESGAARATCMVCAIEKHGITSSKGMISLTGKAASYYRQAKLLVEAHCK